MPIWISIIEWMARLILVILIILSIWGWAIILEKKKYFKNVEALDSLDELKNLIKQNNFSELKKQLDQKNGFRTDIIKHALQASSKTNVSSMVNSFVLVEKKKLESGLPILGTLGSTTPFIGLLGTIMGIIVSFGELSLGKGDMNQVMYSLAEALVLTAVGLFVAIPAVISFNIFSRKLKSLMVDGESLKEYFLANYRE